MTGLVDVFSRPLGLTGLKSFWASIAFLVFAGFVLFYARRLKTEQMRKGSDSTASSGWTSERLKRARKQYIASWAFAVALMLSGPLWFPVTEGRHLAWREDLIVVVVGVIIVSAVFGFLILRLPKPGAAMTSDRPESARPKTIPIVLGIAGAGLVAFMGYAYFRAVRQQETRALIRQLNAVPAKLAKAPPGLPRDRLFLHLLESVDASHAPPDIQKALRNYIAAIQDGVTALQAGVHSTQYGWEISQRKKALVAALKRWD